METDLLLKWLNYATTSKTLPNEDIIATAEGSVKDLEKEDADIIWTKKALHFKDSNVLQISYPRIMTVPWEYYNLRNQL